jgi:hypothetical protein
MDAQRFTFWKSVFQQREDHFTLEDANPNLVDAFEDLVSRRPKNSHLKVFVPLCGRSADLTYLAQQPQTTVVGLDAIPEALQQWGDDFGGIRPLHAAAKVSTFASVEYPTLRLICADIFEFPAKALEGSFDLVWDRGGLTSIAEGRRLEYVRILRSALRARGGGAGANDSAPPAGELLLEFLSCNLPLDGSLERQATIELIRAAGCGSCEVRKDADVRADFPSFTPEGLQYLREVVLLATP